MLFIADFEGEAIAIETFVLIDLRFAVYFELDIVLTIVDLNRQITTLEYSGPISAFRICCKHANLFLYSSSRGTFAVG